MDFTDEEKRDWLEARRLANRRLEPSSPSNHPKLAVAVCLHCHNPFSEGVVTSEAAICDTCNGD